MCCWKTSAGSLALVADVRCGGVGVELGNRQLDVCTVVSREGKNGESAFAAARAFCRQMCPKPRLPKEPIYGFNDWNCSYGKETADNFIKDAGMTALKPVEAAARGIGKLAGVPFDQPKPDEPRKRVVHISQLGVNDLLGRVKKTPDGKFTFRHSKGVQTFASKPEAEKWLRDVHKRAVKKAQASGQPAGPSRLSMGLPIRIDEEDEKAPIGAFEEKLQVLQDKVEKLEKQPTAFEETFVRDDRGLVLKKLLKPVA